MNKQLVRTVLEARRLESGNPIAVDAAFWIEGCSSLGNLRYAVLVREGKDGPIALLDIKEAIAARAPAAPGVVIPLDPAVRVVTGAKALSPNPGGRMIASHLMDKAVFIREIAPQNMKFDVGRLANDEICAIARYLGGVVGHAHGRQMDLPT